jgi:hypothetical protein
MKKLSWYLALVALLLGLFEVSLRLWSSNFESGLRSVHNDPGKCLFHVFVLPIVLLLMCRLPVATVVFVRRLRQEWFLRIVSAALVLATVFFTYDQQRSAFFSRCASPEDLPELLGTRSPRFEYFVKRAGLREQVASLDKPLSATVARQQAYEFAAETLLAAPNADAVKAKSWGAYFQLASLRRHVADVLALLGNLTAVWLFLVIGGVAIQRRFTVPEKQSLLLALAGLSTWLPMRAYSEWYHQFGASDVTYVPMLIGAFLFFAALVLLLGMSAGKLWAYWTAGAGTVTSIVSTVFFKAAPDWLGYQLRAFSSMDVSGIVVTYCILGAFVGFLSLWVFRNWHLVLATAPATPPEAPSGV